MKYLVYLFLTPLLVTGCASTGGTASYAPGSDSAYVSANRGRPEAQITQAQYAQHDLQRKDVSGEMALNQQKQNAQAQSLNNGMQEVQTTLGTVRNIAGMFGVR